MSAAWALALAPVVGLASNVVVQVSLSWARLRLPLSIAIGFVLGVSVGVAGSAWVLWSQRTPVADFAALLALNAVTSGALGFGYFAFVNLNATSIRIRILKEVLRAGSLSRQDLEQRYDERGVIEARLERLVREGQLVEREGRYVGGVPFLLAIARVIEVMKLVVLGRGFDLGGRGPE